MLDLVGGETGGVLEVGFPFDREGVQLLEPRHEAGDDVRSPDEGLEPG